MILTEKEAKYKYCPLLKTSQDKMKFCQGAMCLMWRYAAPDKTSETDTGYCGLAGKPLGLAG